MFGEWSKPLGRIVEEGRLGFPFASMLLLEDSIADKHKMAANEPTMQSHFQSCEVRDLLQATLNTQQTVLNHYHQTSS